jgi:hypothetical protein
VDAGGHRRLIRSLLNRWKKLTAFVTVPGAPLDNNLCERALKKAILHRKNSLFYKTENGARVGDIFMSLIRTAELASQVGKQLMNPVLYSSPAPMLITHSLT